MSCVVRTEGGGRGSDLVNVHGGKDFPLDVAQEDAVRGVMEDAAKALEL